ncbi:aminopeptidase N-like [Anopheles nili]|uniref:aminopeptidase N-like n=1 Tax=Anopheles nili TaxID=185578 RepID=UPI00237A64E6|nr:aminopeptidase N-like [Anopheles nili]
MLSFQQIWFFLVLVWGCCTVESWAQSTSKASYRRYPHTDRLDRNKLHLAKYEELSQERAAKETSLYRLSNDTIPESYELELTTNIHTQELSYSGSVTLRIRVQQVTRSIVLHSLRNTLTQVSVRNSNQLSIPIASIEENLQYETLTIWMESELQQGVYQLSILFDNVLQEGVNGFHWMSYQTDEGSRYAAVSQFQPVDARTAFPCYDEPRFRATFTIIINSGIGTKVYSNMPIASTTIMSNDLKRTRFQQTPSMPTYLVAFVILTDFASKRISLRAPPSNINMEFITISNVSESAQSYGLQLGADVIRAVEQHFNQTYQLPKLDQLAVPRAYFSAMENWGLVIYAEPYLIYDEATNTNRDKENVIATIVHEFVHQFLGNTLTPHWWSDLSLSEGFATFYEYYIGSVIAPEIRFQESFTVEALQAALLVDCDINTRPISYDVENRANIEQMFDIITYQKGGSVLRMFHYALGEQTFLKGVRYYINNNKGRSVTPDDLFMSLQNAAREDAVLPLSLDVATVMKPWIYQSGYPLVTVKLVDEELTFMQEHFLYPVTQNASNKTWWIPVTYQVHSEGLTESNQFWLPQGTSQASIVQNSLSDDGFVLVNPHQTGYYRVNYDATLWQRIIAQLSTEPTIIPAASRGQLIDDCFKMYLSDRIDSGILINLLQYANMETDFIPWSVTLANDNLGLLRAVFVADPSAFDSFSRFVASQIMSVFNKLGFESSPSDAHEDQRFRSSIIDWSCRMGVSTCRSEALTRMLNDLTGTAPLPPYLKESVYCAGAITASSEQLQSLSLRLVTISDPSERIAIIETLACSEDAEFLDTFLISLIGNQSVYLPGEWRIGLPAVYQKSAIGYKAFGDWLGRNTQQILQSIGTDPAFLNILANYNNKLADLDQYFELIQLFQQFQ